MKRFAFRLERVLELRAFVERQAELKLAEKAGVCALLDLKLQQNAEATHAAGRERFRPGGTVADYRSVEHYTLRLKQERDKLIKALALAEAEREQARLVYLEANKKKEVLLKLKEREESIWYKAALLEETKTLDDLGSQIRERARKLAAS